MRRPSTSTVQAPHWPTPQPYLVLLMPTSLRSTYSKGVSGAAGLVYCLPLTVSETLILSPPAWFGLQASPLNQKNRR